jgi:hypothetical protein
MKRRLCTYHVTTEILGSCSSCSRRAPTSTRREGTTAPRCRLLQPRATTWSCSGCSRRAPTSTRREEGTTAPRYRRLQPEATIRSCNGCSRRVLTSTRREETTALQAAQLAVCSTKTASNALSTVIAALASVPTTRQARTRPRQRPSSRTSRASRMRTTSFVSNLALGQQPLGYPSKAPASRYVRCQPRAQEGILES